MKKALSFDELITGFTAYLQEMEDRDGHVGNVVRIGNGFEAWFKFEMMHWIQSPPYLCLLEPGEKDGWADFGAELKIPLDRRSSVAKAKMARGRKPETQIDFWMRTAPETFRFHYIELKVLVERRNVGKQIWGARRDLETLCSITESELSVVDSVSALVFAYMKEEEAWHSIHEAWEKPTREQVRLPVKRVVLRKEGGGGFLYLAGAVVDDLPKQATAVRQRLRELTRSSALNLPREGEEAAGTE